jgi:hypothetical protein
LPSPREQFQLIFKKEVPYSGPAVVTASLLEFLEEQVVIVIGPEGPVFV